MTIKEHYNQSIEEQIERCKNILIKKNTEYNANENPFHTFIEAARLQDVNMVKALAGFMSKHTISIYDMINQYNPYIGIDSETKAKWDEKITDHINYLLILSAMVNRAYFSPVCEKERGDE